MLQISFLSPLQVTPIISLVLTCLVAICIARGEGLRLQAGDIMGLKDSSSIIASPTARQRNLSGRKTYRKIIIYMREQSSDQKARMCGEIQKMV